MDQNIFSLPKEKRVAELKKNREHIIKKLNDDFQKVWFGRNAAGHAVDLEDMTYGEVVRRMVELLYVRHERRWIDPSFAVLTGDFIHRVEERFATARAGERYSRLQSYADLDEPYAAVDEILSHYPRRRRPDHQRPGRAALPAALPAPRPEARHLRARPGRELRVLLQEGLALAVRRTSRPSSTRTSAAPASCRGPRPPSTPRSSTSPSATSSTASTRPTSPA